MDGWRRLLIQQAAYFGGMLAGALMCEGILWWERRKYPANVISGYSEGGVVTGKSPVVGGYRVYLSSSGPNLNTQHGQIIDFGARYGRGRTDGAN